MSVGNKERVLIGGTQNTLQSGTHAGIYGKPGEQPVPFIVLSLEEASVIFDVFYQNCEEFQSTVCYNPPDRGYCRFNAQGCHVLPPYLAHVDCRARHLQDVLEVGKKIAEFCDWAETELEGMEHGG